MRTALPSGAVMAKPVPPEITVLPGSSLLIGDGWGGEGSVEMGQAHPQVRLLQRGGAVFRIGVGEAQPCDARIIGQGFGSREPVEGRPEDPRAESSSIGERQPRVVLRGPDSW